MTHQHTLVTNIIISLNSSYFLVMMILSKVLATLTDNASRLADYFESEHCVYL